MEPTINNSKPSRARTKTPPTDLPGWGIDADPKNDPTYPMKQRTDAEQTGYSWERPTLQQPDVEILKSLERPNLTAVFGTSTPPSGLSGMLRRHAYANYSENDNRHWFTLVLADKINVVECVLDDLASGHVPNIFKEKGYKASWQHDRKGLIVSLGTTLAITAGLAYLAWPKNKRGKKPKSRTVYPS
ncbi:hypothetical protein [Hymenobacter jejuensis]|uniref:hypothetical protein n=1 Tax=Hymenobacter jejuensis TaxID=2502781 RepID=UPI001E42F4FD|nr:hypothetical protein [Hymenobacter jejuensis]